MRRLEPGRQIAALEDRFVEGGGYSEQLATARLAARRQRRPKDAADQTDPTDPSEQLLSSNGAL